jgi:hypothetical protein
MAGEGPARGIRQGGGVQMVAGLVGTRMYPEHLFDTFNES